MNDPALFPAEVSSEDWALLQHKQTIADLNWILDSPPLFEGKDGLLSIIGEKGRILSRLETAATNFKSPSSRRVGLYFESLLNLCFDTDPNIKMEARHLQVFQGKRTLGEIDFCLRDQHGARWRLESTIKFYLHHPISKAQFGSDFVGPDPRDNFERKYHHLMDKQLRLCSPQLEPVDHALPITRGIIFYHIHDSENQSRPSTANPDHLRGIWMKASEWNEINAREFAFDQAAHLPKPYWLSGIFNPGLTGSLLSWRDAGRALKKHFEAFHSPLMMSLFSDGQEPSRCIVVNDLWPNA